MKKIIRLTELIVRVEALNDSVVSLERERPPPVDRTQPMKEVGEVKGQMVIEGQDVGTEQLDQALKIRAKVLLHYGDGLGRHRPSCCEANNSDQVQKVIQPPFRHGKLPAVAP